MRLLPKTEDVCHEKSMGAFQYLIDRTTNLYNVDEEGRNLLHMTAQNGCFFMMHLLISTRFYPTLTNARNGWNMFHYLANNDDEDNRSDKSLEYLMYEDKLCWFDILDSMIISDRTGLLAVFKEECGHTLFTEQERAETIALLQQLELTEKTSGILKGRVANGLLNFKHQIFAEYFAACWLYENKDRMRSEPFFRSWSFWKEDFRRMRDIFDRLVLRDSKGCEIHLAVVNHSELQVRKLLYANPSLALVKDSLGRLPLHLSVWNKSLYPMEKLLKTMTLESINVRDELFQWSALDYAFVSEYYETAEILLDREAEVDLDTLLEQLCSNNLRDILIEANKYGGWLQLNENTKKISDQLTIRV
uniref:Uncharacterized protein n=1 Tax=Anopheles dirus TaxID=7168 RepID=A0A182NW98_9DIPT